MSAGQDDPAEPSPLHLVHHHPGRLRVRAEAFLGEASDDSVVADVRAAIEGIPGVTGMTHNPQTGSLLIHYEPGLAEPGLIAERIADAAGLDGVVDDASDRSRRVEPATVLVRTVKALNGATREITGGRADLTVLVPAALASVAAYSFAKSDNDRMPRWDNLMWWSYSMFLDWHRLRMVSTRTEGRTVP